MTFKKGAGDLVKVAKSTCCIMLCCVLVTFKKGAGDLVKVAKSTHCIVLSLAACCLAFLVAKSKMVPMSRACLGFMT